MPLSKMKKEQAARVAAVRSQEAARSREAVQKRRPPPAPAGQKVANIFSVYSVLTTIAKFLPVNKLLKLRATSNDWNTAFSQELIKRSTRFRLIPSDPESFSGMLQESKAYLKSVKKPNEHNCSKYLTFHDVKFFYNQPNELERVKHELFTRPFSKLEEVCFDMFSDEFEPNPIIPPLTPIHPLPSVRKLELDLYNCSGWMDSMSMDQLPEPIQQFIEELIQSCTCLQVLVLPMDLPSVTSRIWRLLPRTLTKLHLNYAFSNLHARTISEMIHAGLHLTSFDVSFMGRDGSNQVEADFQRMLQSLSSFLSSQAGSLLHLQLQGCSDFGEFELFIPTMPRLRSFASVPDCSHFEGCRSPTLVLEKVSLDLNFPNLTKLKFHSYKLQPVCLPLGVQLPGLRKLVLSGSSLLACRHFSPYTQYLTQLKVDFRVRRTKFGLVFGEYMELVCTSWPLLEELDLTLSTCSRNMDVEGPEPNIDELLTGVSKELHTKPPAEFVKSRPGIGDLRHLRKFKFISENDVYGGKVGDVTGYFIFANPESRLQLIKINNSAISAKCEDAIRVNLGMACVLQLSK